MPENHVLIDEDKKYTGETSLRFVLMISANMVTLFRIRIEYTLFLCLLAVKSPRRLVVCAPECTLVSGVGNVLLLIHTFIKSTYENRLLLEKYKFPALYFLRRF